MRRTRLCDSKVVILVTHVICNLAHYLHEVLVTQVVFLNIASKVLNIEAPPTNEDDSIAHLHPKILNRTKKVLKRHV